MDIRNVAGWPAFLTLLFYMGPVWFIWQSEDPRNLFYINEMFMAIFVVLVTYVWFQQELGGGMMEMLCTYPLSLTGTVLRKLLLVHITVLTLHLLLMRIYVWRLGPLRAEIFSWRDGTSAIRDVSWWELYVQALPGYVFVSVLAIVGFMLSRHVYGGLGLGFAYWLLEGLTAGGLTKGFTLYTYYLFPEGWFVLNRLWLIGAGGMLLAVAIGLVNRRSRWIGIESDA